MSQRATRAPVDGVRLLPLAKGKFVIQVRCAVGAYNEFSLLFAWDEHSHSTPKLIQFPRPHGYEYLLPLVKLGSLGMREFEAKRAIVYVLEKIIGDGSGGFYAEYRISRTTFVPELIIAISKPDADYVNGYNFEHGRRPAGSGWKVTFGGPKYQGCLIDVRSIDRRYAGGRAGCP